jgi:hypothetical protein
VFAHSQYLALDAYNLGMVVSLFCLAVGLGVVFAATRSIFPSFIAHALINVPMAPLWQGVCLAALLVGASAVWPRGRAWARQVFSGAPAWSYGVLALVGAVWAVVSRQFDILSHVAVGLVLCAVVLHATERRRNSRARIVSVRESVRS